MLRTTLALLGGVLALAVTLVVGVVTLPFWLVSSLTAGLAALLEPASLSQGDIIEYDPDLGWKVKANQRCFVRDLAEDPHRVTTDAHGWRGRDGAAEADVVAFGDSFAFGDGIDDAGFFAHHGGAVTIKAVGAPGYNMVQGLLLMRRLAPELTGKTVVWLVYLGNDLADNLRPEMDGYRTPFLRRAEDTGSWHIHTGHLGPQPWTFPTRLRAHELFMEIATGAHLGRRAFAAAEHLIGEARDVLEGVGARLVVVSVPDLSPLSKRWMEDAVAARPDLADWDSALPDRELAAICRRLAVRFLPLASRLSESDYRDFDVHWNEEGSRKVGAILARVHADPPPEPTEKPSGSPATRIAS
jgi:hypothetical protein